MISYNKASLTLHVNEKIGREKKLSTTALIVNLKAKNGIELREDQKFKK
jgi:hypothetical protein